MKTVILCGGFGTRIRNVTDDIPKPMNLIGGYPILWHIMNYYAHWGYKEFILCLGYKGNIIKDFFLNYDFHTRDCTVTLGNNKSIVCEENHPKHEWKATLADTGLNTLTGARVKRVQKYLVGQENFMLTYGDGVGNIDINKLLKFHLAHKKILTVSGVRPPGRFGELIFDNNNLVTGFNEKPQVSEGRISGGFFVCRKELFDYLEDREDLIFEQEPIKKLVEEKQMMVFKHDGFWQPMDTYRDYLLLNNLYMSGKAPWVL